MRLIHRVRDNGSTARTIEKIEIFFLKFHVRILRSYGGRLRRTPAGIDVLPDVRDIQIVSRKSDRYHCLADNEGQTRYRQ